MNPFPDLYNNMQTPPTPSMFGDVNTNTAFIPNSFPTPIVDNNSADLIGNWPSLSETDLLAAAGVAGTGTNIPMSSPFTNTSSPAGTVPNMMDNQQAQMVMMMMQQQQEQQQQQQMLLRQQQQQQQQLLMQKRAAAQAQAQAQAMNQQQQQPPPWFLKQQQTKMMAAQTQQTQQVPSPNNSYSVSNSSSPMHVHQQSPLLNMDQQSQQSPAVQANIMNQSAVGTPILPSSSVASPNIVTDTADLALLAKRVEVVSVTGCRIIVQGF
jgi:transcription initiation factor TFIID subunit TAF12